MSRTSLRILGLAGAVLAGTVGALAAIVATPTEAAAADLSDFDPGYIISDANFYDSDAMTAAQVQSFLNGKVPTCHEEWSAGANDPIVCLKNYSQTTTYKAADAFCDGYTAKTQTAAQIINGVARSCGVSQKVLLVLLQKETGLVTHTYPSEWRYDRATGFACPDTAPCDTQYYGFFNQLYSAARQYKIYQAYPNSYGYVAGYTNRILYHPKSSCGRKSVDIRNQATAGLYIYTPYTPNQAALNAGYGTGNSCSSYGNRNFFAYYSDWFGSPVFTVGTAIKSYWSSLGGDDGPGYPTSAMRSVDGGVYQEFENSVLFISPSGVKVELTSAGILTKVYLAEGGPSSSWGWPTATSTKANGIWRVPFTKITAYNRNGDVRAARVPLADELEAAWYGYDDASGAIAKPVVSAKGTYQRLRSGYLYLTASGESAYFPSDWRLSQAYLAAGGPAGDWGWPHGDQQVIDGVYTYEFDDAMAFGRNGTLHAVVGDMLDQWTAAGGISGPGYPTANATTVGTGEYQTFVSSVLFMNPSGTEIELGTNGVIVQAYLASGGPAGTWGWPTGPSSKANGIYRIPFSKLTAYAYAGEVRTSTVPIASALEQTWFDYDLTTGAVAAAITPGGGTYQQLTNGYLFRTSSGKVSYYTASWILTKEYLASGGPTGPWGWPLGDSVRSGATRTGVFQHVTASISSGALTVTPR
ncbi:LGFP repeat-containing protein [Demequina subtropica]|uniref:LGFP repeat-containing protein n=1 Tax=Demequina subtropica TaxID=1638989 RepID=UPI0007829AFF|nr:hypothetical protein [Demequina subtropica]